MHNERRKSAKGLSDAWCHGINYVGVIMCMSGRCFKQNTSTIY